MCDLGRPHSDGSPVTIIFRIVLGSNEFNGFGLYRPDSGMTAVDLLQIEEHQRINPAIIHFRSEASLPWVV